MQQQLHVVTLAVLDLERAFAFYHDGLGWESPGIIGTEFVGDDVSPGGAAAMFQLPGGLTLSLYGRADLARDAGIPAGAPSSGEFSLGHLVPTREDVDALLAEAVAAGAEALGEPHDRPWGIYSAYFRDPDGHLWEIIWNPGVDLDE
jgi:catechol 2,3-dioxygenase-like lactoylglutathione lyase family enzyme